MIDDSILDYAIHEYKTTGSYHPHWWRRRKDIAIEDSSVHVVVDDYICSCIVIIHLLLRSKNYILNNLYYAVGDPYISEGSIEIFGPGSPNISKYMDRGEQKRGGPNLSWQTMPFLHCWKYSPCCGSTSYNPHCWSENASILLTAQLLVNVTFKDLTNEPALT